MRTGREGQAEEYARTGALQSTPSVCTSSIPRIAVFASGSGSNFQALAEASRAGQLGGEVALLVCDKPGARVLERAREAGVPAAVFEPKRYESRGHYERDVLGTLSRHGVQWIALAGYMRLVTPVLLEAYEGRILNIHPSLLPSFPGLHAVRQALDYGVKVTGVTVHLVDAGMDTGPIVAQEAVAIGEDDTLESLLAKIQEVEHRIYPQVVRSLLAGSHASQRADEEDKA
ncbi:phosphoribosylglycinamide formyltransferase [Paenibacillus thiaminolyticus]|nr:phosphoribosylglycinamide formyltransferase [Paenibacillus thiaminolyticus]